MEKRLTLFELNHWIGDALNNSIPGTVWVMAEITELKENRNGHCYLDLAEKKENEIIARARATIWSYTFSILKPYFESTTGRRFTQGLKVLLHVSVEYHPVYGLSLNVKDIDPAYTIGDLALQRKEILDRLKSEGVFHMNKELALPLVPQNIAVISSKTAAGYQDFMNQLESNASGIKFYTRLFEAYMQGSEAVPSIVAALEKIFEHEEFFDAVAIIRGGGAAADLSCFDDYHLAYHVTQFPLPVITGIGHEKDDTIIDLVAHTRLKTPTAVAEFFINGAEEFLDRLIRMEESLVHSIKRTVESKQEQLEENAVLIQQNVSHFIYEKNRQLIKTGNLIQHGIHRFSFRKKYELNNLIHDLNSSVSAWRTERKSQLEQLKNRMKRAMADTLVKKETGLSVSRVRLKSESLRFLTRMQERIYLNESKVRLLNPENILKRGFSLTLKDGVIVKSVLSLQVNDSIETRLADGRIKSIIINKE
jgi:exodeoxyribonuclease VII large subunit